jgi:hypothetical protein
MRKLYFSIILFGQICLSQNFTDTKGELQISNSGTVSARRTPYFLDQPKVVVLF